jgi:soluble lytic murein transglycosylase-like protein
MLATRLHIAVLGLLGVLAATPAAAEVFVWEDEQGNLHFSDRQRHTGYAKLANSTAEARIQSSERLRERLGVATGAWDGVIAQAGREHGIQPGLLKAMIHVESLFELHAVSRRGAQGLMQLMPRTARHLGVDDPFDPWQNISGGTRYLVYLMKRFQGDEQLALAAYNAGETTVRRYGGIPPYRETEHYVKRVMSLSRRYDADFRR